MVRRGEEERQGGRDRFSSFDVRCVHSVCAERRRGCFAVYFRIVRDYF